ncbi:MAG: RNase P subunit p30 family protein [Promethearchaeota archaeon]
MSYFESRLRLNVENFENIKNKFAICEKLGIKNVIVEPVGNFKNLGVELREKIKSLTKMQIYYRISLRPRNVDDLKNKLIINKKLPTILSIETPIKEIQIQAAKDSRVDVISFTDPKTMKTLTPGVISLSKQNKSFIEISLSSMMVVNKAQQSKNFRELYRIIHLVKTLKGNLIISGNFEDPFHLRHPRSLISICHTLLGLSILEAKKAFNENVKKLIERVYDRYDTNFIEYGIKFIKGGE